MKTSNIKPTFSAEQARGLPVIAEDIVPESFTQLTEGHFSQAFSYETTAGEKRALRLSRKEYSFIADKFAHDRFNSAELPIPKVLQIGQLEPELFYCISEFASGLPSDQLSEEDFSKVRTAMEQCFAQIFHSDISTASGSGKADFNTGNGADSSYQETLQKEMEGYDLNYLREQCSQNGIASGLVDSFMRQFEVNLPKAHAERRLIHGDLGFDNVLVDDSKVTAVIDWSAVGYGDWLHDYSRIEFWHLGRHTPSAGFAKNYGLEVQNFEARLLTHMAHHAISALNFAFRYESESTVGWLREHLAGKLESGNS
jgi:aminoglycoside phosphotransferase (APT) family kinase protein